MADRPGLEWGESPWEDWDHDWRERQTPVEVTSRLVVCPPWIAAPLLEDLDLRGKSLLDMGTGTGILSVYAAGLGAAFVTGFDIDPVTGPCLHENLDLNPTPPGTIVAFFVGTSEALRPSARFDAVVTNMIRTEIWPYLDVLLSRLRPGGSLAVSGQRIEDQPYWREWFTAKGLKPFREFELDGWWGFVTHSPST